MTASDTLSSHASLTDLDAYLGLRGKTAIVTGAGSGIGAETARLMCRVGMKVVVVDLGSEHSKETVEAMRADGMPVELVPCDVSDEASVEDAMNGILGGHDRIDVLCNIAGVNIPARIPINELDGAEWRRVLQIDLDGVFHCSKHIIGHFKKHGGGCILNMASIASIRGIPYSHAYGAAKHGVLGLTREMAVELAPHKIRVNSIAPGRTDTPLLQRTIPELTDDVDKGAASRSPFVLAGGGRTIDIANAVLFLISDAASWITGVVLPVDGGRSVL